MPFAITHILIPIILLEIFRDYFVKDKSKFPLRYVLIGGIAGILPDLDIGVFYILSFFNFTIEQVHRTFSHSLLLILIFLIPGIIVFLSGNRKLSGKLKTGTILLIISFAFLTHIILDGLIAGQVMPLYPLSLTPIGLNLIQFFPLAWQDTIWQSIEAGLLVLWLIYLELRHKISAFL
jgi:membrane-bound metal-dependent hydrolase YbcI (DUF457 family)